MVLSPSQISLLLPTGVMKEGAFAAVVGFLAAGDKIVIYSDGLTEAESASGAFFDTERLRQCLRTHAGTSAAELHAALLKAVDEFTEGGAVRDDITALVIEYKPGG